ncbi:hypothetical protein HPP92_022530 [Vanilla planifolia]|uniref:Uncharacterized protein n=1 Tax=Vanilla planifolia TaxID=51239 RepID=A0A835UDM3_VANPL|nr:hypothetical protein HPP92_022530 [Vanilla planifolia]
MEWGSRATKRGINEGLAKLAERAHKYVKQLVFMAASHNDQVPLQRKDFKFHASSNVGHQCVKKVYACNVLCGSWTTQEQN